jgi:DNA-binding CsgD family transcriptional regulator
MEADAVYRSVRRACCAGLDSVTLRREVAARIAPAVAFDANAFSTCDPDTGLMTHTVADGVPEAMARLYVERLYPDECACLTTDLPRAGVSIFSMLETSRVADAEMRALGQTSQLHVSFTAAGRLWGTWCLLRFAGHSAPGDAERALLRRLTPHVVRGLQTAALVEESRAAAAPPVTDVAAVTSPGVIVLDVHDRPVTRTPLARVWLDDLADVGLRLRDEMPLAVLALIARLRRPRADVPGEARVRTRGRSGRWYVLRASLAEPDAAGDCAAVVVVRPAVPREVAPVLTRLYGLSEREREIAAAVARGESTKEIAAALAISPHTVEEHIERACAKMSVRGRKALVAKLFFDAYAPPALRGRGTS